MTCRGSRFKDGAKRNPDGQVFMKGRESDEWLTQNMKSTRNFIRKWGSMVQHNEYLKPIIPPKYDIGLVIDNCTYDLLKLFEPYCNTIYLDNDKHFQKYIDEEQPNSRYDLGSKLITKDAMNPINDIVISFDANELNETNFQQIFLNFPRILEESGEPNSDFELDIFGIQIKNLDNQVDTLVNVLLKMFIII